MKLQILVPQLNEGDSTIKILLDSISLQKCIDFNTIGVVICNGGSDVRLSRDFLDSYPFRIDYHLASDAEGVSATRNMCLDHAKADYVMFSNIDDMFYDVQGLRIIFDRINEGNFDMLVSTFKEEKKTKRNSSILVERDADPTFIYGKVYRRQYLVDNNIRFDERLKFYDDTYFNILAQGCTDNIKYCKEPFYLWCWRDGAVYRHDMDFALESYDYIIDSYDYLISEFERRGMMDKVNYYVCYMTFHGYYSMNRPEWIDAKNKKFREDVERTFAERFRKYREIWEKTDNVSKVLISDLVRRKIIGKGMLMESITISDWLKRM